MTTTHFHDLGVFGRVHEPPDQYAVIFGDTEYLKTMQETSQICFEELFFRNLKNLEIGNFENVGKDGNRQIPKIRHMNFRKSCIWDQDLSTKDTKWTFGNMVSISINKHEMDFWNCETLKL